MIDASWEGRVAYDAMLARQLARREAIWAGAPGHVFLCEHDPVITLGRSANRANVLAAGDVPVVAIERGGDVTYHGPGQLMVYPVVRVKSIVAMLAAVGDALAEACVQLGAPRGGFRREPGAGVWIGEQKLAACGIHVARGVSVHGFALDVATPKDAWRKINPCGAAYSLVSLAELGVRASVAEVAQVVAPLVVRALGG